MRDDHWKVEVDGKQDGTVSRLGPGHAWVWKRENGEEQTFDCGCAPAHVQEYIGVRMGLGPRGAKLCR